MNRLRKTLVILAVTFVCSLISLQSVFADFGPIVPIPDSTVAGLLPQVGGEELSTASTNLANFSDIKGAYYDATYKRIVFIGVTTGTPKYNQDDMAVAIKSILYNNVLPDVTIGDDPANPAGVTGIVTYTAGLKDTNFASTLFNADYKYKQYAIGYTPTGTAVTSAVPSYKSVVQRYLALTGSPVAGNKSSYAISPQNVTLKNDTSSSSIVFTNLSMQATAQAVNPSNDPLWNQAANNFVADITTNYDQYASETPELAKVKQLSKMVAVLKWISDYGIQSDFHSLQGYTPQYVSTPATVQKITTPSGYSAQGQINYNTPNTYLPDDGTAAGLKTSAQAGSSSKEDVTWTFTNNGQSYQAVAIAANAFKSLGAYSTSVTDISIPTAGDLSVGLRRNYNSFSLAQSGMGVGWTYLPAQLGFNAPAYSNFIICGTDVFYYKLAIDTAYGHETYTYSCGSSSYVPDEASFHSTIIGNSDYSFVVTLANQVKYNFNANFQLTSQVDKIGNAINYTYDGNGKLASIADTHSHAITVAYNTQNLISSITDWTSRKVQYTYDSSGRLTTVTDPLNNNTVYGYDANNRLTTITDRNNQVVLTNTFNPDAKIATQKSAGNITNTFSYDTINRTVTQTDNNSRVNKIYYDANARVLQNTDANNKSTFYTYGTESSPLTVKDKNNNTTTYTYDSKGNMTTITYPDTKVVTYTYDAKNRVTNIADTRYSPTKNTSYTYNTNGTISQKTEGSFTSAFTYDSTGEMLTSTDPLTHTTTWTRDSLGNKLTEKDALNNTTTFTNDSLGRITQQTDPNSKTISYTYDANGNLLTVIDATGTTTNTYDKENRITKVTLPDTTYTQYTYNSSGSLTSTIDALSNTTTYGYDNYQNLTTQQDALLHTKTNTFNVLNQQTQLQTPLGKTTSWQFDSNGNISQRTDANSKITSYQYDNLNHLKKIIYPDTTSITYNYDYRGNLTSVVDTSGTSTFVYDAYNRLTNATNPFSQTIQYAYDNAGNLTQLTYPDSKVVVYTYDNTNRLSSVKDWNNQTTNYTYNSNGTLATRVLPNGITTYYTYDNANRLTTIEHKKAATTVAKFQYTRNLVGDIKIATESGTFFGIANTNTFFYDNLRRIVGATYGYPSYTYSYTYDKVGNRLTNNNHFSINDTYTYDNDNRLATINGHAYGSDNNGNRTSAYGSPYNTTYTYNFENNLIKNQQGSYIDQYKYDGLGNRYEMDPQSGQNIRFINDTSGSLSKVLEEYSLTFNSINKWYLYGLGNIAEWSGYSMNAVVDYYLEDGMGNTRFMTNNSGSMDSVLSFDPYGVRTYQSGGSPAHEYDGQRLDSDTNFYFLRARYYDPATGRFITRDTLSGNLINPLTQNPYIYAGGNPINQDDPSGKCFEDFCIGESIVAGAIISQVAPILIANIDNIGQNIRDKQYGDAISSALLFVPGTTTEKGAVQFSEHALERLAKWNISLGQAQNILRAVKPFKYFHQGEWKLGYFDESAGIFIGKAGNTITTVIGEVTKNYIKNLMKAKP